MGTQSFAQMDIRLEPVRRDFLLGEKVALKITFINQTDQSIAFSNTPGRNWLNFTITRGGESYPLSPTALPKFPNLAIPPGSKRSFELILNQFYAFGRDGAYQAIATVRMPDRKTTYSSNRASFTLSNGGTIKTYTVQRQGKRLKMSVKSMAANGRTCLFGQVTNADSGSVIGACYLGVFLNFMEPRIILDSAQNLHVLCQSTPEYFSYGIMRPDGSRQNFQVYQRSGGPVDLISTGGGIRPLGLTPYKRPTQDSPGIIYDAADSPF